MVSPLLKVAQEFMCGILYSDGFTNEKIKNDKLYLIVQFLADGVDFLIFLSIQKEILSICSPLKI